MSRKGSRTPLLSSPLPHHTISTPSVVQQFCGSWTANQVQIVRAVTHEAHDGLALKR